MGSGKNGAFDKIPDWQQWAILAAHKETLLKLPEKGIIEQLYGSSIAKWLRFFKCETFTVLMLPIEGHGSWDKKNVFGSLPTDTDYEGPIAVITRATIRLSKLKYFWQHVAGVAAKVVISPGYIASFGIGELPWIKQATISFWQSKESMKLFAYHTKEHNEVIKNTRKQDWYSEEMFTRLKVIDCTGTVKGISPLA